MGKKSTDTAVDLRKLRKDDLEDKLKKLKQELSTLRVAKVTGGAASKLSKIRVVRKTIARVMTVMSQQRRTALKEHYSKKKYTPIDLRPKLTRAIRRRLTPHEKSIKTLRQQKREAAFPPKKYFLRA